MKQVFTNASGFSVFKLISSLALIAVLCAGAYLGYLKLTNSSQKPVALVNVSLKPEIIEFTNQMAPELYQQLLNLDQEITLIDQEFKRLNQMEADFPRQKKIISAEKFTWTGIRKDLSRFITGFEQRLESLYVAYMVNQDNGASQIAAETKELTASAVSALQTSGKYTGRLKSEKPKNILEQLKDKLL